MKCFDSISDLDENENRNLCPRDATKQGLGSPVGDAIFCSTIMGLQAKEMQTFCVDVDEVKVDPATPAATDDTQPIVKPEDKAAGLPPNRIIVNAS